MQQGIINKFFLIVIALQGVHCAFASEMELLSDEVLEDVYLAEETSNAYKERADYYYKRGIEIGAMYKDSLINTSIEPEIADVIKRELAYTQVFNEIKELRSRPKISESDRQAILQLLIQYAKGLADSLDTSVNKLFKGAKRGKSLEVEDECSTIEITYMKQMYRIHHDQARALCTLGEQTAVDRCLATFREQRAACKKTRDEALQGHYFELGVSAAQSFVILFKNSGTAAGRSLDKKGLDSFHAIRKKYGLSISDFAEKLMVEGPESEFFITAFPLYKSFCQGFLAIQGAQQMRDHAAILQKKDFHPIVKSFIEYMYSDYMLMHENAQMIYEANPRDVARLLRQMSERGKTALMNYQAQIQSALA